MTCLSASVSHIWFVSYTHRFILHTRGINWTRSWPAPKRLHNSVGRALHRYRRGHGFESCWSLRVSSQDVLYNSFSYFITARITSLLSNVYFNAHTFVLFCCILFCCSAYCTIFHASHVTLVVNHTQEHHFFLWNAHTVIEYCRQEKQCYFICHTHMLYVILICHTHICLILCHTHMSYVILHMS